MQEPIIYEPVEDFTRHGRARPLRVLRGVPCPKCGARQSIEAPTRRTSPPYWKVNCFICGHCRAQVRVVARDDGKWELSAWPSPSTSRPST